MGGDRYAIVLDKNIPSRIIAFRQTMRGCRQAWRPPRMYPNPDTRLTCVARRNKLPSYETMDCTRPLSIIKLQTLKRIDFESNLLRHRERQRGDPDKGLKG